LLQKLSPLERAVFVLKESFGYGYEELSEMLDINADYCRQLFHRASERVQAGRAKYLVTDERKQAFATAFLRACTSGEQEELIQFLQKDITIYSDGGGKALAAPHPIAGVGICSKFLVTTFRKRSDEGLQAEMAVINGMPGVIFRTKDGFLDTAMLLEEQGGLVTAVYFVRNPDKLDVIDR
jgi:RNA polymerase sigma-70 factor (ECF subfamily)